MVDDNDPEGDDLGAAPVEPTASGGPTGPRRSTYTPPKVPGDGGDSFLTSDDEIANMLASQYERAVPDAPSTVAQEERVDTPRRPQRHSIPVDQLAATLEDEASKPGNTLEVMDQLEQQLSLREQEVSEFERWETSMRAIGTPEAIAEVENARAEFRDILDRVTSSVSDPVVETPAVAPEPTHTFRRDDVLDSELHLAPAPMTPPISDIPPPPGHATGEAGPTVWSLDDSEPEPARPLADERVDLAPAQGLESQGFESQNLESQNLESLNLESQGFESQGFVPPELVEPSLVKPDPVELGLGTSQESSPEAFSFESLLRGQFPDSAEAGGPEAGGPEAGGPEAGEAVWADSFAQNSVRDSDVGDTDRVFADLLGPFPVTAEGVVIASEATMTPLEPISSPRIPVDEQVFTQEDISHLETKAAPVFSLESSALEPTPLEQRVGRASRLFWMWFAANASVVSVAFGGTLFSLGMSLRQSIVAVLAGVAVSFVPLGLGTLAGKWSGQPTMVVSRAAFGHVGNILPAVLALITRLFWGAILLWFLAAGTARILVGAELGGPLDESQITSIGLVLGFLLALAIAFFGYRLIVMMQLVFSVISGLLIVGLIAITWPAVSFSTALTVGDGPWILVVTGAVLVFSFVGLVWAVSSADLARYQRSGSFGATSMLWATFGSTLPAFILITYGALLAASNPEVASGMLQAPLDTIALLIPIWYPVPLIAALALSLLSGIVITIYSGGFALQTVGVKLRRPASVLCVGVALALVSLLLAFAVGDFTRMLRDIATSLAVPVAAWAGIFAAEMMIRSRRFDSASLLVRGGIYSDLRWTNLIMLLVGSAVGFGLTTATVSWLTWQGYLFGALGIPLSSDLAASDLGVFVALAIGLLTPIVAGIPDIRRQEQEGSRRN